jgi:hypothetical protein
MRRILTALGAVLAASIAAFAAIVLVFPFGLILDERLIYPLALSIAAVFAALAAGWTGTLLAPDRSRTRLLPAVGATFVIAVVLSIGTLLFLYWADAQRPRVFALSPFRVAAAAPIALALTAALATTRLRGTPRTTGKDLLLTVGLLALTVVSVPATIALGAAVGLAGA